MSGVKELAAHYLPWRTIRSSAFCGAKVVVGMVEGGLASFYRSPAGMSMRDEGGTPDENFQIFRFIENKKTS